MRTRALCLSILALTVISHPVFADDTDAMRGRLPDGRAFRTDAQGNQLVDYIAELELSVEQLNRRVQGLEFEVEEKQRQVDRLSRGSSRAENEGLAERDILGGARGNTASVSDRQLAFNAPKEAFPSECPAAQPADCSTQVSATQQMLEKAKFDLEVARRVQEKNRSDFEDQVERMRAEYSSMKCPVADCSADVAKVRSQAEADTSKARQELEQNKLAFNAEREAQQKRIADYEATLASLRANAASREVEVKNLELKLAAATTRQAPSTTMISASVERAVEKPVLAPIVAAKAPETAPVAAPAEPERAVARAVPPAAFANDNSERASFSAAKARAVDSLRGSMIGDLNRLRDLIASRDSLFQGFNQDGRSLTFKPSPLISGRGYTYSWVAERVKSANNIYELSALAKDIREIRSRVQEDVELIKRMKRTR